MSDHSAIVATLDRLGLTVSSVFVPFSASRNAKPGAKISDMSLNWKVTLQRNGRDFLTFDYSAGIAHCPSYAGAWTGRGYTAFGAEAITLECEKGCACDIRRGGTSIPMTTRKEIMPDALNVIASLCMDSSVLDEASFENWASSLGYDTDSRKAEAIYRTCLAHALALRNAVGEAGMSELQEAFQDY